MTLATSIDLRPVASTGKMWGGMVASGTLHVGIALFLIVGVPQLFRPDPPQLTMPVDIVNLEEMSELASLPAEQIGPIESAEESKPVEEVDEVARPQQAAPQPAPAVEPTPPAPSEAPAPEPTVQPETAAAPPSPDATAEAPPPPAAEPEPARPAPAEPLPAEPAPADAPAAEPAAEPVQPTPDVAAVEPEPQAPPPPEPRPTETAETAETPPETAEPVPQPEETPEASEEEPLMAGVLPLPTPPRPEDAPEPEPQPEAQTAAPSPPPTPVRSEEQPEEEPTDDLLAGVLRNVDKNLKPSVTEQQQAARGTAEVTQSADLTRRAAALGQMIRGQMQRCWRIDPGARSAERLRVSVRVRLKPDGTLMAPPDFQNVGQMTDSAYYRAAAESARRAILDCQPFRLPQEDYNLWQDLVLNFDPREMF